MKTFYYQQKITLQKLSQTNEPASNDFSRDNLLLLKKLKHFERTRHLMMWHNGYTLLYGRAVFLSNKEDEQKYASIRRNALSTYST